MRTWSPLLIALTACGGLFSDDNSKDAASDAHDASTFDGPAGCVAPGGQMLCNGPCGNPCPQDSSGVGCSSEGYPDALGICSQSPGISFDDCDECRDGNVCVFASEQQAKTWPPDASVPVGEMAAMACSEMIFAQMYSELGRTSLARYADRSTYTDEPLPTPSSCPTVSGLTLCGGSCGACPSGYVCSGRSPLHPYSLCVNDYETKPPPPNQSAQCIAGKVGWCSNGGLSKTACLTFKVDDAAQPIADANGICVDTSICQAAAAGYPGGAICTP